MGCVPVSTPNALAKAEKLKAYLLITPALSFDYRLIFLAYYVFPGVFYCPYFTGKQLQL